MFAPYTELDDAYTRCSVPWCRHAFEDVQGAGDVALDVVVGVGERVAHARLRGEVHDAIRRGGERGGDGVLIAQVGAPELERGLGGEPGEPGLLELRVVVGVHVVEPDHGVAAGEQVRAHVRPDEPGRAGDQHSHASRHVNGCGRITRGAPRGAR